MNTFSQVPPGFRFHPTDEELVDYYLRRKIAGRRIDLDVIKDIDLYKIEPWDLQELCSLGTEDQSEWYFFSHKDKKYPTGTRTNRATTAGFWKATGRDKAIYSKHDLIGMRKTLVFYKGRAPNGQKSDWIMHEYRLETDENNGTPQEEGWVVCRAFKKRLATTQRMSEHDSPISWYDDQISFMPDQFDSPKHNNSQPSLPYHRPQNSYPCKKELVQYLQSSGLPHGHFFQLPLLESPKMLLQTGAPSSCNSMAAYGINQEQQFIQQTLLDEDHLRSTSIYCAKKNNEQAAVDHQVTDWRVLDKFVASQLSQEEAVPKEVDDHYSNILVQELNKHDQMAALPENASTSTSSSCQMDLWKQC